MTTPHPNENHPKTPGRIHARVYYEDTDAGGIVYHSNYFKFAERGRTEMLRELGYNHAQVREEHNIMLVVRHAEIGYHAPGKLDDWLTIDTAVSAIGNTSITMKQTVTRAGKILAEMKIVVVAITPEGRAVRIPSQLRQIFGEISA